MEYIINQEGSRELTFPTDFKSGDKMVFNYTGLGNNGLIIPAYVPVSGEYEVELWGANGSVGSEGRTANYYTTQGAFPPGNIDDAGTSTTIGNQFIDMTASKVYRVSSTSYVSVTSLDNANIWKYTYPTREDFPVNNSKPAIFPATLNKMYLDRSTGTWYRCTASSVASATYVEEPLYPATGSGAHIKGVISLSAADQLRIVIGQKGSNIFQTTNRTRDGVAGATGGATYLFRSNAQGLYTMDDARYGLFCCCASGGGTNDMGYNLNKQNGHNALSKIYNLETYPSSSDVVRSAFAAKFVGRTYSRSSSTGIGGFGYGIAADDTKPSGMGFTQEGAQGTSFIYSGGEYLGLNDLEHGNGKLTLTLISLKKSVKYGNDGIVLTSDQSDFVIGDDDTNSISVKDLESRVTALENE